MNPVNLPETIPHDQSDLSELQITQVFWVVGAAQRLANLGLYDEVPMGIPLNKNQEWVEIDKIRRFLFDDDFEIASIFYGLVTKDGTDTDNYDEETFESMTKVLIDYKDNRTELVRCTLEHSFV